MPCPHSHETSNGADDSDGQLSRRQMIRAAVAIGGTSGLSACVDRESTDHSDGTATAADQQYPAGPDDLGTLPERQHAWVDYLVRDRFGNTVLPQHQTILMLNYTGPDSPDDTDREQVEAAFQAIERAFQRGTGGDTSAVQHEGILFAIGYAPAYFDRFDADLPESIDLPNPETLLSELDETEVSADSHDAVIHLAGGYGSVVLAAERALFGDLDSVNGTPVDESLSEHFEINERRTGFIGRGQPAQKYGEDKIPENSPLSMGFKSGFADNLPSEDDVTIREGPFAGGTTMQVSRLEHDLASWYDHGHQERTKRMFSPAHDTEDVGDVGEDLASFSGVIESVVEHTEAHAEDGVVGHGQKIAHARDEDFRQRILRRDFNITDEEGMHFDSWQRGIGDFLAVRKAMNGDHVDTDVDAESNGILDFIDVTNRATFLMPPRSLRALPTPQP